MAVEDRTAVLVIRVWTGGTDGGFRARLMKVVDVDEPGEEVATAADVDTVVEMVRDWFREVLCRPRRTGDEPVTHGPETR